eukprot:sb/3464985/
MSSSVWVLCPNGRRVSVPVTPGTPLNNIKQQACEKQGFAPNQYGLRKEDQKKNLDLSVPFRLSGLTNKAKLELVEEVQVATKVNIALQLDTGERCQGQVSSSLSLTQTITSIAGDNISASHIIFMQRRIDAPDFPNTTLSDLGILRGGAALRLNGVTGERVVKRPKVEEKVPVAVVKEKEKEEMMEVEEERNVPEVQQEVQPEMVVVEKEKKTIESAPVLFRPASTPTDKMQDEETDFFEVNETDVRTMLRDIRKVTQRDLRLRSSNAVEETKIPDTIVIRIRFPDGCQLQDVFRPTTQTTDELYNFVLGYLSASSELVLLHAAPPRSAIERGITLADAGLRSTTLLHAAGKITLRESVTIETGSDSATRQLSEVLGTTQITNNADLEIQQEEREKKRRELNGKNEEKKSVSGNKGKPKWFKM